MELMRYEPPLEEKLIEELSAFWEATYGFGYDGFRHIFEGDETAHNLDIVYVAREGETLVGTCHLTMPLVDKKLGGLGEVATSEAYRGRGVAGWLCEHARDDFAARGGRALFLGTGNPAAARIYERLGWRTVDNSVVYGNLIGGGTIERFYEDYWAGKGAISIVRGSAAQRISLIPLNVYPHETTLLDSNTEIYATKFRKQEMCLGLYPKYSKYENDNDSAWFCAVDKNGSLAGLSTAKSTGGKCNVDGFVHPRHARVLKELLQAAIKWADDSGNIQAQVAASDALKQSVFESLGFCECGRYDFDDATQVILMEKPLTI